MGPRYPHVQLPWVSFVIMLSAVSFFSALPCDVILFLFSLSFCSFPWQAAIIILVLTIFVHHSRILICWWNNVCVFSFRPLLFVDTELVFFFLSTCNYPLIIHNHVLSPFVPKYHSATDPEHLILSKATTLQLRSTYPLLIFRSHILQTRQIMLFSHRNPFWELVKGKLSFLRAYCMANKPRCI